MESQKTRANWRGNPQRVCWWSGDAGTVITMVGGSIGGLALGTGLAFLSLLLAVFVFNWIAER